jgi:hypothetical protein
MQDGYLLFGRPSPQRKAQLGQYLESQGTTEPQFGQYVSSRVPHMPQKRAPGAPCVSHREHKMTTLSRSAPSFMPHLAQ